MNTLIVIPAYNEQDNIKRVVDNLIENYPQFDYVVVNDGSKDNTSAICHENGYNIVDLPVNLGLRGAFQTNKSCPCLLCPAPLLTCSSPTALM